MKNRLLQAELILLLESDENVDLRKAYINFVHKVHNFIERVSDLKTAIFTLQYTRIELTSLANESDEPLKLTYLSKAISIIDAALECVKLSPPSELSQKKTTSQNDLNWTADKCNAVEIIYALYHSGCLNNGEASLKSITSCFEQMFNIKFINISTVYMQLRGRVGERCTFLNGLQNKLNRAMTENDK